ncbi:MAG: DUF2141 domain-containing protein [Balneola sp.]
MKNLKLLLGFLFMASSAVGQTNGNVTVRISDIKDQGKGEIILMLFSSEDGFPMDSEKAIFKATITQFGESLQHTFNGIPFGTYALAAFQDKNRNGKVDTRKVIPMPKEPVAALNVTKRGRPEFKNSTFEVRADSTTLTLTFLNQ